MIDKRVKQILKKISVDFERILKSANIRGYKIRVSDIRTIAEWDDYRIAVYYDDNLDMIRYHTRDDKLKGIFHYDKPIQQFLTDFEDYIKKIND